MKHFGKDCIGRQLAILFLAIFILVKANPYYYLCQYFPHAGDIGSKTAFSIKTKPDHCDFLVRVQKSIVEEHTRAVLPAIKFSGIPLILFALGVLFIPISRRIYHLIAASSESSRLCIAYCILRL